MSITETNKLDIVAVRPDSSIVKLVIADHLDWDDFEAHARLLQDKVNTYLEFVASGQLARMQTPKLPESPEVRISLVLQHTPSKEAAGFLSEVADFVAGAGMKFEIEIRHPTT